MKSVESIHIAPVKSLGLGNPQAVHVNLAGIIEDRRFFVVNARGRVVTQREVGRLVQIKAEYRTDPEWLCLTIPNRGMVEGPVELGDTVVTRMWGRKVAGNAVTGGWSGALSGFCQEPVTLVRSAEPGQCYDEYPISLLTSASVAGLNQRAGGRVTFESKRFRPNFLIGGCEPHEEDTWLGRTVQIGETLRLRVVARDPRCLITSHNPETGDSDIDTPRLIASYRPDPRAAYFGVYGIVERTGMVATGDIVTTTTIASS